MVRPEGDALSSLYRHNSIFLSGLRRGDDDNPQQSRGKKATTGEDGSEQVFGDGYGVGDGYGGECTGGEAHRRT